MVRESSEPIIRDENAIQALKSWGASLVRPSEMTTIEVKVLKLKLVNETTETSHHPAVKATIALISSFINNVEIPTNHPHPRAGLTQGSEFL